MAAQDPHRYRVKVPSHPMPSTVSPISELMRSFISRAALLVKVTAKIWLGHACPVAILWAMRVVSARVFPVPAPANSKSGPSSARTAARCSSLRPSSIGPTRRSSILALAPADIEPVRASSGRGVSDHRSNGSFSIIRGTQVILSVLKPLYHVFRGVSALATHNMLL